MPIDGQAGEKRPPAASSAPLDGAAPRAAVEPILIDVPNAGFAIGRSPVSLEDYRRFAEATGRAALPASPDPKKNEPARVTWQEAMDYAAWLSAQTGRSYRLPTEEEWGRAFQVDAGLRDTTGSEQEWTCSEYRQTYEGQELRCATRPPGAVAIRGGSWRAGADPLSDDLGFRLVRKP